MPATKNNQLTPKQKRFCEEYVIDLNATQAYKRAGYSAKTDVIAASEAFKLLRKPNLALYIAQLQSERSKRTEITADMVVLELAKIGFSNLKDYVNGGNSVLELKYMEEDKTAAVQTVKVKSEMDNKGNITGSNAELKLYDKVGALELLGKHLGIFEKDNKQKQQVVKLKVGYGKREGEQ